MTLTEFAEHIGRFSILLLWTALLLRARPAWKGHYQRGLWLAILSAATATTLFHPDVINAAVGVIGDTHAVTLSRNVAGVLAAGLTVFFLMDSAHPRRADLVIAVAMAGTVATLLGMDLAHGDYPGPGIPTDGGPAEPSAAYWVVVCAAHLLADTVIAVICWRYSGRTRDRDLAWSLRLFAFGSLLAIAYWAGYLVHLHTRVPELLPYLSIIINVHGVSRALTLLVPTATSFARSVRHARTVWVLWPMWRDLSAVVPSVALVQPQSSRLRQLLRTRTHLALQAYRQTIEIYDAILDLRSHLAPDAYQQALARARRGRASAPRAAAAALAGALGQARLAKLAGQAPTGPQSLPDLDGGDTTLLLAMARHWPTKTRTPPTLRT